MLTSFQLDCNALIQRFCHEEITFGNSKHEMMKISSTCKLGGSSLCRGKRKDETIQKDDDDDDDLLDSQARGIITVSRKK